MFVFTVAAVSFVLTLLLVSVYKLLLNYFHQLLLRPHLHPEQATVPGSRLTILPSPSTLPCRPGLACWQDLHFRRRQTFHLHCFCQCLCLQCLSPANPPLFSSPVSTRMWTWYESSFIAHRVQKLIYCCGGEAGRIFTTFVSVSVWFFISFDFPSQSFHVCVIVYPPSLPLKHIENIPCPFGSSSWLQISFMTLTWLNDLFIQTFLT